MQFKKFVSAAMAASLSLMTFSFLPKLNVNAEESKGKIKVAAIETAYGADVWRELTKQFTEDTGVEVELIIDKQLEKVIGPSMQAGDFPDVIHLALNRKEALTEQFVNEHQVEELTDVLTMKIPGEEKTVQEKLLDGIISDSSSSNPYADGKTYLAPMFYAPCGLFYNEGLFEEKGWKLPETWDEMWELAETSEKEGISLFTYPSAGYFDALLFALMYEAGGQSFFFDATHYKEGAWDTEAGKKVFNVIEQLSKHTNPITPSQANQQDFTLNQQLVLDNKALFMPNGTWVVGEMAEAPRADGFKWGMMALPALEKGGDRYSFTFLEQAWMPKGAENKELGKEFISYLYSDKAAGIFAKHGAVQPIYGVDKLVSEDNKLFYQIYENGAKPAIGGFAPFKAVAGLDGVKKVFMEPIDALVSGTLTMDEYIKNIKDSTDVMRENME